MVDDHAFDALGRLAAGHVGRGRGHEEPVVSPGSNFSGGHATTLTAAGTNVYTVSAMSWQGSLLAGFSVSSAWDGGGSVHAATYDADAHLQQWTASPLGTTGAAQQKFGEGYTFSLENLKTVNTTNNLGFNVTATYNYNDATSAERVSSISVPNAPTTDNFVYDRRGRGLIAQHKLSATQTVAQDAYEYDSQNRLTSISHLGAKLEDLAYDGAGDLVSRTFPTGAAEIARYYIGDQLTLVNRSATTKLGYAHIQLGGRRIASFWVKSASGTNTNGVIYYHRDRRNDVVATTKNGGAMGVSYRYLPYGAIDKVINSSGVAITAGTETDDAASELGFIGGLKLSGGLIHLEARAYSPTLRRFLQPDTVDFKRYTYAHGDPLNFNDPSGRADNDDDESKKNEHTDSPKTPDPNQGSKPGNVQCQGTSCTEDIPVQGKRPTQAAPPPFFAPAPMSALTGTPNTIGITPGRKTKVKQARVYGPDGRVVKDIDFDSHGGKSNPHVHDWDWSDPDNPQHSTGRDPKPGEIPDIPGVGEPISDEGPSSFDGGAAAKAAAATAGTYVLLLNAARVAAFVLLAL